MLGTLLIFGVTRATEIIEIDVLKRDNVDVIPSRGTESLRR
jgi:hypothetical protein